MWGHHVVWNSAVEIKECSNGAIVTTCMILASDVGSFKLNRSRSWEHMNLRTKRQNQTTKNHTKVKLCTNSEDIKLHVQYRHCRPLVLNCLHWYHCYNVVDDTSHSNGVQSSLQNIASDICFVIPHYKSCWHIHFSIHEPSHRWTYMMVKDKTNSSCARTNKDCHKSKSLNECCTQYSNNTNNGTSTIHCLVHTV